MVDSRIRALGDRARERFRRAVEAYSQYLLDQEIARKTGKTSSKSKSRRRKSRGKVFRTARRVMS